MAARSPFEVFSLPSAAELVEQAVLETLAADEELAQFTAGRIYWVPDPFAVPDRPLPFVVITATTWDLEHLLSGEKENELRVGILIAFEEGRAELEPRSRTVRALQARIDIALTSNRHLEATQVGFDELGDGRALVDRYVGLETVEFRQLRFEGGGAFTELELRATYEFTTTATTGEVVT